MKKNIILFMLSAALSFTACQNHDDQTEPMNAQGEWQLIKVSNGFGGTSRNFERGTIAWTFNDNNTVTVENLNTDEEAPYYFESGTYDYHLETNTVGSAPCEESLFIDSIDFGCKTETATELKISAGHLDGDELTFIK